MSGGFRGNPRRSFGGDVPLVKLVEQYLLRHKQESYINIVDMGDEIRRMYPKYNRMTKGAFSVQLNKAYTQYSENARRTFDDFSGENIVLDNQPLNDETLRQMEGYASDTSSDLEIDENPTPKLDTGSNQMKSLYRIPHEDWEAGAPSEVSTVVTNGSNSSQGTPQRSPVKNLQAQRSPQRAPPAAQNEPVSDDESDLEIIEELHMERSTQLPTVSSVITNLQMTNHQAVNAPVNGSGPSCAMITISSVRVNEPPTSAPIVAAPVNTEKTHIVPKEKKNSDSSRGVKRKLKETQDKEGIDEDYGRKKSKKEVAVINDTGYKLQDFAGSDKVVEEICKLLMHLKHPEVYQTLGVTPPRGFLLHGPPGTGKTLLANAIAGEMQIPMLKIAGTELVSGISGESESNIRELFNQAVAVSPCIVFIDEIDSVTPRRENVSKEMERRIVAQLLSCIDELVNKEGGNQVLLIGATNRVEAIDTALRRAGRFDREICLGIPDESSRAKILDIICRQLKLETGFDTARLAKLTPGYVGADLQALVREAAVQAVNRKLIKEKISNRSIIGVAQDKTECATKVDVEGTNVSIVGETKQVCTENEKEAVIIDVSTPSESVSDVPEVTADAVRIVEKPESAAGEASDENQGVSSMEVDAAKVETGTLKANETSAEVPDSTNSSTPTDVGSTATDLTKAKKLSEANAVELDCTVICETPIKEQKTNIANTESEPMVITLSTCDTVIDNAASASQVDLDNEDSSPLRWIKDTAPLSEVELRDMFVTMKDFELALKNVQPSSKREGFATVPDTTWDDIGALQSIRDELQVSILGPVKHSEAFKKLGLNTPAGVLLCGPPGCGKTLLAKAVANEAGINFISVKGPELLNMYVGESERAVRQCFLRARNSSPCVIFFDELDALCPRRSDVADSGSSGRIVNQLLTEMDGMESRQGVFVMAASNRPDIIDPAVLRPGRLDKILFVNLPTSNDRHEILKALTKNAKKPDLAEDVNLEEIANCPECEDYTGADLAALVREASIASFRELVLHAPDKPASDLKVFRRHFTVAFTKTKPSVGKDDRKKYKQMAEKYSTVQ